MTGSGEAGGVLVVDSSGDLAAMVTAAMSGGGQPVALATSPVDALAILATAPFALVVAHSGAGGLTGAAMAEQIAVHGDASVLLVTSSADALPLSRLLKGAGFEFLTEPFTPGELERKIAEMMARRLESAAEPCTETPRSLDRLSERFGYLSGSVASSLIAALSLTHRPTHEHCERVALRSAAVAQAMGSADEEVRAIYLAGLLHDLGKVTVSSAVLDKPGPLDADEMAQVRSHPETAERIVSSVALPAAAMSAIRHHHEWFDGSGYPDGLAGAAIPFGARVISVCDAYDAMTTERPYKAAVAPESAMERLAGAAATQFDPEVVRVFCGLAEAIEV